MSVQEDELEGLLDFMVLILQSECLTRCYCRSVLFLFFCINDFRLPKPSIHAADSARYAFPSHSHS